MKVTIIIPIVSPERLASLYREIESLQTGTYKNIHIVVIVAGDPKLYRLIKMANENLRLQNISVVFNKERSTWIFCQNRMLKEVDSDYYIYGSDDIVFHPHSIKDAVKIMQECFPDGFGLVNLWRSNRTIIGLIGRKFVEHFPGCQVFCPDYIHYCSDTELSDTVKKLGKRARLSKQEYCAEHLQPKDNTFRLAQEVREKDAKMREKRKEKGYLWGIDFNLVREK